MFEEIQIDNDFRIEKIDPVYRDLFQSALPFLNTRSNEIHTFIVYQYAQVLLIQEPGDRETVLPACILHDVGWSTISPTDQLKGFGPTIRDETLRRKHEAEGVIIAERLLKTFGVEEARTKRILEIIDGHDSNASAISPEDAIVKDSDKLWRYSETGFRVDMDRFKVMSPAHIKYLANHINQWFLTKEAIRIARFELECRKREQRLS